ncbi:hypothetical protein OROMI_014382 [Orobanche minor]
MTSPRHAESALNSFNSSFDSCNIREVLKEDDVAKKLLQTCTMSLLYSRHLLCGNLVVIPLRLEFCLLKVVGAEKVPELGNNEDVERNNDSFLRTPNISNHTGDAFLVDHGTKVQLSLGLNSDLEASKKTYSDLHSKDSKDDIDVNIPKLGGLSKEYSVLKDIIDSSIVKNTLSSMGLRPTKGVLLHGPPGTGKTSLARLCANDAGVNLFSVNGPEIVSQFHGESEKALDAFFDPARSAAPAVVLSLVNGLINTQRVFIDELDAIAPSRKEGGEELSERIVATLLTLMDGINRTEGVLVIAATNRPDSIKPALRRPGRFDREIEIGACHLRVNVMIYYLLCSMKKNTIFQIWKSMIWLGPLMGLWALISFRFATKLHLFVLGAALVIALEKACVSLEDFKKARIKVRPSAMREIVLFRRLAGTTLVVKGGSKCS